MLCFVFVPSIVEEQKLWFVFVPSIVQERINSLFFVPLIVEGRIYSFRSKKNVFVLHVMEPRNRFQGTNSASQCSLSPYFLTFKEPRNRFQGTNSVIQCCLTNLKDRSGANSVYSTNGKDRSGMHQLQNFISQKLIKLFEQNFQRVFLYTCTASSPNLSSLALSQQKRR